MDKILTMNSLHPEKLEEVLRLRADIGICLDGDADRLVLILWNEVDGDQLLVSLPVLDREIIQKKSRGNCH